MNIDRDLTPVLETAFPIVTDRLDDVQFLVASGLLDDHIMPELREQFRREAESV